GGTANIGVQALSSCVWRATTGASWLTVTYGQTGSGQGTVSLSAAPNTTGLTRVGVVIIGDKVFKVFQDPLPPMAINGRTLTIQQGSSSMAQTIATFFNTVNLPSSLTVTVTSLPPGITVGPVTNNNGTLTAMVAVDCTTPLGNNSIGLKVT